MTCRRRSLRVPLAVGAVAVFVALSSVPLWGEHDDTGSNVAVPVRVHLLRAKSVPSADCVLTPKDVGRIFQKANKIWLQAHIHLTVESIVEEEAAQQEKMKEFIDVLPLSAVHLLRPPASQLDGLLHVYYVHRLKANGVFRGIDCIFVQDTAQLREVPGGIDEPLPRVTSHEIGHAFGLQHRQALTNLLASGTTGTLLDDDEIKTARNVVQSIEWKRPPDRPAK